MNNYPNSLINLLSVEQRNVFLTLLNKKNSTNLDLTKELNKLINSFGGIFREEKSYRQILEKICEKKQINTVSKSVYQIEQAILENKFNAIYNSLSEEDRKKFDEEIQKIAKQRGIDTNQAKSISAIGTLAGANLAGFGLYIMASTVVGGLTSAIGLTLPFAFYTGMSSVLSIVTGPVGWLAGLGYVAYTFRNDNLETAQTKLKNTATGIKNVFTGNIEHCEVIISQICSFRILLQQDFENQISQNKDEIDKVYAKIPNLKIEEENLTLQINSLTTKLNEIKTEIKNRDDKSHILQQQINELERKLSTFA